jgi:hypothetical protein
MKTLGQYAYAWAISAFGWNCQAVGFPQYVRETEWLEQIDVLVV